MRTGLRILLIAVLQSVALIVMVGIKQYTLATGAPVVIKTTPIDPRSLFRGDYVSLNYTISTLSLATLGGETKFVRGDTVYVVLHKGKEYWEATSVYHQMPKATAGEVVIKGKVRYAYGAGLTRKGQKDSGYDKLSVTYGIENYFVPEHTGSTLERPGPGQVVSIQLAIDRFGNAAIKAVLVNGKVRYQETVF